MSGRAVRLDIVSRLSLSSSSFTVPSGLCRCGGTTGVDVAVACTASEAGRFGDGAPAMAPPFRSNTGAEWMEKSEPSWLAGWFMFSSMIAVTASPTTISCDDDTVVMVVRFALRSTSTSCTSANDEPPCPGYGRHCAVSWKLHSRGNDISFPRRRRLPRWHRGNRNTLDYVIYLNRAWGFTSSSTALSLSLLFNGSSSYLTRPLSLNLVPPGAHPLHVPLLFPARWRTDLPLLG